MPDPLAAVTPEVVVVGGTNVDIRSRSAAALVAGTSNPGTTQVAPGGVGRNIAEVLARLGVRTLLVSAVGDDLLADAALGPTAAAGVDLSGVRRARDVATGTYHAILDEHGGLAVAVSAMAAIEAIAVDDVLAHAAALATARRVVLDANLPPDVVVAVLGLAARARVPVALEPVSVAKATRVSAVLRPELPVALVTPNADELAALAGTGRADLADLAEGTDGLRAGCDALHARGVSCVSVRLGERGTFVSWSSGHAHVRTRAVHDVADVTGAGDTALGGHLWAELHRGADAVAAARAGNAAALVVLRAGGIAAAPLAPHLIDTVVTELEEQP